MKLSDFDYDLPRGLIAQTPARPRDHARLLVYERASRRITDDFFYSLDKYLPAKTTMVLNNSKVERARLLFGKTEIFILQKLDPNTVQALVRPGKKFLAGGTVGLEGLAIEVLTVDDDGVRTLRFSLPVNDVRLDEFRRTPFPPYVKPDEQLGKEYQTVYAKPLGSVAAPTAGLHFTPEQLAELRTTHPIAELTLHVGLGTFAPVKSVHIDKHKMHSEHFSISTEAAMILNRASHITAVGTTSSRVLESVERPFKRLDGSTEIFIKPGYEFKNTSALITNFHLPKSTLLMLVAAMTGLDELQRIYAHAISEEYRFYSFGDAMLVL